MGLGHSSVFYGSAVELEKPAETFFVFYLHEQGKSYDLVISVLSDHAFECYCLT
jgi:hypothetical protein